MSKNLSRFYFNILLIWASNPVIITAFILSMLRENYLNALPENPFNGIYSIRVLTNVELFPTEATGEHGWIYKPKTKTIKLNWPGTDSSGVAYFDY